MTCRAWKPGRQVEDRAVRRRRDRRAVLGDQDAVLVQLAQHEDQAHHEGDGEPAPQAVDVAALRREHAELAGDRRQHQDDREDRRVRQVQLGRLRRPPLGGPGSRGEVHGEQPGEEHQLAGEPDDRADADHVRSGQGVHPRGVEGAARDGGRCHAGHHGIGRGSVTTAGAMAWRQSDQLFTGRRRAARGIGLPSH